METCSGCGHEALTDGKCFYCAELDGLDPLRWASWERQIAEILLAGVSPGELVHRFTAMVSVISAELINS